MGTTLAQAYVGFLADAAHLDRLRPHTLRAYRYELALAAADPRFAGDLAALSLADLEAWIARAPAAPSTVGRRAATFRRFFAWAVRHDFCAGDPLAGYTGVRVRRHLPRPIREVDEQRRLDAAIAGAPQPYRLIFTLLRETGMRAGEALALRRGDVTLDPGREALRVREPKSSAPTSVPTRCRTAPIPRSTPGRPRVRSARRASSIPLAPPHDRLTAPPGRSGAAGWSGGAGTWSREAPAARPP